MRRSELELAVRPPLSSSSSILNQRQLARCGPIGGVASSGNASDSSSGVSIERSLIRRSAVWLAVPDMLVHTSLPCSFCPGEAGGIGPHSRKNGLQARQNHRQPSGKILSGLQAVTGLHMHPLMAAQEHSRSAAGYVATRKSRKSSIWPETNISIRKSFSFAHKGCALLLQQKRVFLGGSVFEKGCQLPVPLPYFVGQLAVRCQLMCS